MACDFVVKFWSFLLGILKYGKPPMVGLNEITNVCNTFTFIYKNTFSYTYSFLKWPI